MKHAAGWIAILIVLAVCVEVTAFATLSLVPQFKHSIYRVPDVTKDEFTAYMANRDPDLGWPHKHYFANDADNRGARLSPANAALGEDARPCISVYGDSFAFSHEAEDQHAWTNVLADRIGCRVDNFGVGGFGADQAVLRLERHVKSGVELGDTLILTLYPDNLNRHMNQWRHLLTNQPLTFKPAFRVDQAGNVVREPIFDGDYEAFLALTKGPKAFLPAERYMPGADGFRRKQQASFPYTVTFSRLLIDKARSFRGVGSSGRTNFYNYPTYYDTPDGPSDEKKAVTRHIIQLFAQICDEQGKTCAFVITPDPDMVLQRMENGTHDLKGWLQEAAKGLIFLDGTDIFADLEDICAHLTNQNDCRGHYNTAGYARLAAFVDQGLKNAISN